MGMACLHCGDCCERMSPLSAPDPCPHIERVGTFVFCAVYAKRPEECRNHQMPYRFCPIGVEKLRLERADQVARRIDDGYALRGA